MSTKRRNRVRLSPSWLPTIRAMLAKRWKRSESGMSNAYQRILADGWDAADGLSVAPLWWVTSDMTRLAVDTAMHDSPPDVPPPSPTGFIVFDGGVREVTMSMPDIGLSDVSVDAIFWTMARDVSKDGGGVTTFLLRLFTADRRVLQRTGERDLPLTMATEYETENAFFDLLLQAVFALCAEPRVCETRPYRASASDSVPRRYDPALPAHRVKMLVLRENLHRPGATPTPGEDDPSRYSHRWIVRGFYRDQPYGPRGSLRRRQWIPPYVKGPADKPLIVKETVRLWRR